MRSRPNLQTMVLTAVLAAFTGALTGTATAAVPMATTLNDLCPGTPDPCVVTGKFIVPHYAEFDAGGRQFIMKAGASLTGLQKYEIGLGFVAKGIVPLDIRNAASIHIEEGAKLDSPVRAVYECQPRTGIVGAGRFYNGGFLPTFSDGGSFTTFEAGGTHKLRWLWSHDELPVAAPSLTSWGVEICTSSGCTPYMATDVPQTMSVLASTFGDGTYYGVVESSLTLPPIPDIERVRVINLAGTAPAFNDYNPMHGFSSEFFLNDTSLLRRGSYCVREGSEDFNWSQVRDPIDFRGITLQSTGPCTIGGKVLAKSKTYPATIDIGCAGGVTISAGAKFQAPQGGQVRIDAGAGNVSIADGVKIDLPGPGGYNGGGFTIEAGGACDLGGKIVASAPVSYNDLYEEYHGGGGSIDVACGSVTVRSKAKLISAKSDAAQNAQLSISAATGSFQLQEKALLSAPGAHGESGGLAVTAKGRCTVDGEILTAGMAPEPMTFVCGGFEVGASGTLNGSLAELTSAIGGVSVDTTGTTTGDPPADCLIRGEIVANGASDGGEVRLDCGTSLSVASDASISANGQEFGGYVGLTAGTTLSIDSGASVYATGSGPRSANDSVIDLFAPGNVTIGGTVNADSQLDYDGGTVNIEGCNVTITEDGRVSSKKGWQGRNTLTAHGTLQIDGPVATTLDEGINVLVYRNAVSIPNPSLITPATTAVQNAGLSACP